MGRLGFAGAAVFFFFVATAVEIGRTGPARKRIARDAQVPDRGSVPGNGAQSPTLLLSVTPAVYVAPSQTTGRA